jgi:hypothetical protein
MRKILLRPTHFTFHREGPAPRFRVQCDEAAAFVRIEFTTRPQLLLAAQAAQRTPDTYFSSVAGADGAPSQTLQLSQGKLTYQMPTAVWDRLKGNPHIYYRVAASTDATPDWDAAPPRTIRSVDDGYAAQGRCYYFGVPNDRLGDPWNFPDQGPLAQVDAYYRAKLTLLTRYPEAHEAAYLLRRLVGHENYTSLPPEKRVKALLVFASTDTPARRAMLQMFSRTVPPITAGGTATPAVRGVDLSAQHSTLLDNLATLVDIDPHLEIPDGVDTLVAEAIEEVADPSFELNQGTKGTCVPTSVSWIFATYFPAEYVRLMTGLLSEGGRATLANGDPATVPADAYSYDPGEQASTVATFLRRSWSERLFQSSMMCYSRPGINYSNIRDIFADRPNSPGLTQSELRRMLRGLRNREHQTLTGSGADLVTAMGTRLQAPSLPILTQMVWGPNASHEVVSLRVDAADVTFRNPWGGMNYRVGQTLAAPTRRCVNPSAAEEAIARVDLAAAIQALTVEA